MSQEEPEGGEEMGATKEAKLGEDLEALRNQMEQERARAESYLGHWQRAAADYLNLKRRSEQERAEITKFANSVLILNLLPILDDLERAFSSLSPKLAELTWVDGIRLIQRKLQAVLEAQGVSEIKAMGETFDPNLHEAVLYQEGEEGKVLEVVQRGYNLHDRVIRPSLVIVGKKGERDEATEGHQGG